MLAEPGRRRRRELARRARQRHQLARHAGCFPVRGLDRLRHAEMHDLRVGIDLVDREISPDGTPAVEPLDPVGAGAVHRVPADLVVERVAMPASLGVLVFRPVDQLGRFQRIAESVPRYAGRPRRC